jgi:hypothetical protein
MGDTSQPMDLDRFWALVEASAGGARELKELLARLSREEIVAFDQRLAEVMFALDQREIHDISGGSDDGFEYVRLWIISRGQQYFESVMHDPENAPHFADEEEENEEFGYAAAEVYEERFGEPMPPRQHKHSTQANRARWVK